MMAIIDQFKPRLWHCLILVMGLLLLAASGAAQTAQADTKLTTLAGSLANASSLANVVQFAAGENFTCALTEAGAVHCWGDNSLGQLGDGTNMPRVKPVQVLGVEGDVIAITAGHRHACALRSDGTASCWGNNASGQLGDGGNTSTAQPVAVAGISERIAKIDAGNLDHTCAMTQSGKVFCWGYNSHGQSGVDPNVANTVLQPSLVVALTEPVIDIAMGGYHSCAVTTGNQARCWGQNFFGELGDGTQDDSFDPVTVSGLTAVSEIVAATNHTCALNLNGAVTCWGWNAYGQLGNGGDGNLSSPVDVYNLSNGVTELAASGDTTCASLNDNSATCWGSNEFGQLGSAATLGNFSTTPATVENAGSIESLSLGIHHACAVVDGEAKCWGSNRQGQLGAGTPTYQSQAVAVSGLAGNVADITAGSDHSCAITVSGAIQCWGFNGGGPLGNGQLVDSSTPVDVIGLTGAATALAAGGQHTCAMTDDNAANCWGLNSNGQLGRENEPISNFSALPASVENLTSTLSSLALGNSHTCGLTDQGGVVCWGDNRSGQSGSGTISARQAPTDVVGLEVGISSISAGLRHTCAVKENGSGVCWGSNHLGRLGDGTRDDRLEPVTVIGLPNDLRAISAGSAHTCGLTVDDSVVCWGTNGNGQLAGNPSSNVPIAINGLSNNVTAISAGDIHTCALLNDGSVKCWGENDYGRLGDGTTARRTAPMSVLGLSGAATAIAAGGSHTCALLTDGTVQCWGRDEYGQIGNGRMLQSVTPVAVSAGDVVNPQPELTAMPTPEATAMPTPEPETPDGKPLVLIYAVLDNNLGDDTETWERLINNAELGMHDDVNVRLLVDGSGDNDSYIYALEADDNPFCPSVNNPRCNDRYVEGENFWRASEDTAHPETIYNFLVSGVADHPDASNFIVSMIGHGSGWSANYLAGQPSGWAGLSDDRVGGMLWDDNPGNGNETTRSLSTKMLGAALRQARIDTGRPVDLLYLDACSMAMSEVVYELKDNVRYLLASPNIAWASFAYDALIQETYSDQTTKATGLAWLAAEANALRNNDDHPFTLTLFDLTHLDALATAVSTFGDSLRTILEQHQERIQTAYDLTEKFESDYNGAIESESDAYIDLDNFAVQIIDKLADEAEVAASAEAVRDAISLLVVNRQFHNGTPWTNPDEVWAWEAIGGLSVYMPLRQDETKRGLYNDRNLKWAADTMWDEFLGDFWDTNGVQVVAAASGVDELPTCESTRNCSGIAFRSALQSGFDVHLPIMQQ